MPRSLYFAYGSNLSAEQMAARCPGAKVVGRALLPNHALTFAGFSTSWGGAVANVERAAGAQVEGVLYELPRGALSALDRYEGHPFVYRREQRRVLNEFGNWRRAYVYVQVGAEPARPPLGYLGIIFREYKRRGFDVGPLAVASQMQEAS